MAKRAVFGLLASVLAGLLCAGAFITLVHLTKKSRSHFPTSIHTTSKAMMTMNSLCSTALHEESCELMLSKLSPKRSSLGDPRFEASFEQSPSSQTEISKNFIDVTLRELEKAVTRSEDVANGTVGDRTAAAKSDCGKLLTDTLQYARAADALVRDKDIESLTAEADNIGHMLSALMTYMYTCVDSFGDANLNTEMDRILSNATVMGSNALGVINNISSSMVKTQSQQPTSRKLLGYDMHGNTAIPLCYLLGKGISCQRIGISMTKQVYEVNLFVFFSFRSAIIIHFAFLLVKWSRPSLVVFLLIFF